MLKVIYGSDVKLLELELTKEIKKHHFDSIKVIKDLTNFTDIYLFTHQINLFEENKVFVFYNNEIFSNLDNFLLIEKYLNEISNDQNINLIILYNNKISLASKIQNFSKQHCFIEVKDLNEEMKINFIENFLINKNICFDQTNLNLINVRLPNNAMIIENELNKLIGMQSINNSLVKNLIVDYDAGNIFSLIKALIKHDINQIIVDYNKIISTGEDIFFIFQILSYQAMQIFFLKKMKNNKQTQEEIINSLKINYYSYKNLESLEKMLDFNKLILLLDNLYLFDLKLKNNLYDKNNIFKIFLLNMFKLGF